MACKSAVHALAPFVPVIPLQLAAQLDIQHDLGHHAQLNESGGLVIDGEVVGPDPAETVTGTAPGNGSDDAPTKGPDPRAPFYTVTLPGGEVRDCQNVEQWISYLGRVWERARSKGVERDIARLNSAKVIDVGQRHRERRQISAIADQMLVVLEGN